MKVNPYVLVILVLVLVLAGIGGAVFVLRAPPTPPSGPTPLPEKDYKKELDELKKSTTVAISDLKMQMNSSFDSKQDKVNDFTQKLQVAATAQLEKQVAELIAKLEAAQTKGDTAEVARLKTLIESYMEQLKELKKKVEDYKQQLEDEKAKNKIPTNPENAFPTTTTQTSSSNPDAANTLISAGLAALCFAQPELCPFLAAFADMLSLFGSDTETRDTFLDAIRRAAKGDPIDDVTLQKLAKRALDGKLPQQLIEKLTDAANKLPPGPNREALLTVAAVAADDLNKKTDTQVVKDMRVSIEMGATLQDVKDKHLTKTDGKYYYDNENQRSRIEILCRAKPAFLMTYWEAANGLKSVEVKKQ